MPAWEYEMRAFWFGRPRDAAELVSKRWIDCPFTPTDGEAQDDKFLRELSDMGSRGWEAFYMRSSQNNNLLTVYFRRAVEE